MWNRLALVLGVIGSFALPSWWVLSRNIRHNKVMTSGYETCITAARDRQDYGGWRACSEAWIEPRHGYLGWTEWWQGVGVAAAAMVALYLILAAGVWTAKWIWRGRDLRP